MIDVAAMQASPQWQGLSADQQEAALAEAHRTNARAMTQPAIPAPLEQRARAIGADPLLVRGIVATEGSGDRDVSPKGAIGRFQIMPATAARYGVSPPQLRNPQVNEVTGLRLIRDLGEKYREKGHPNWRDLAAAAYFSGEGNITPQGTIRHPQRSDGNLTVVQYVQRAKQQGGWGTVPTGGRMEEREGQIDIEAMQQSQGFRALSPAQQQQALGEAQRRNAQAPALHPQADMPTVALPQAPGSSPPAPTVDARGRPILPAGTPDPNSAYLQRMREFLPQPLQGMIFPRRPEPGTMTGVGAGIGQAVGGGLAAATIPATSGFSAVAIPAAAAGGAMLGYTAESVLRRGTFPSWKELAVEGGLSLAPEVMESGARAGGRAAMRGLSQLSVTGKIARHSEQYRRALANAMGIFDAPTKEAVDELFDQVRATGAQMDTAPLGQALTTKYTPAERRRLVTEMGKVDAEINRRLGQPGTKTFQEMYTALLESIKPPAPPRRQAGFTSRLDLQTPSQPSAPSLSIGDAQDLRSAVRVQSEKVSDGPVKDLLQAFKQDVDDMILTNLSRQGDPTTGPLLAEARHQYHRFAAAEDYTEFLTKHSRGIHAKGQEIVQLDFNALMEDLRKNTSKAAQNLNRHLDALPGVRDKLNAETSNLSNLQLFFEPSSGVGAGSVLPFQQTTSRMLAEVMMSSPGIDELVKRSLAHGGQITPNILSEIVSIVRRQKVSTEEHAQKVPDISNEEVLQAVRMLMQGNVPPAE